MPSKRKKREAFLEYVSIYRKAMNSRDKKLVTKAEALQQRCYMAMDQAEATIDPILKKEMDEAKKNLRKLNA